MSVVQALRPIAVPRQIPVALSVVAGYVDSCTYLGLFGVFVAQVTGSFVFAGASFISIEPGALAKLLAIPVFFLAGVALTVLVHPLRERPRAALARSLGVECILLVGFAASCLAGMPFRDIHAAGRSTTVRDGSNGRTKCAGPSADAERRLYQCSDYEYDTSRYKCGRNAVRLDRTPKSRFNR
jgi:uncharacterized protein DUF1275